MEGDAVMGDWGGCKGPYDRGRENLLRVNFLQLARMLGQV